MKKAFLILVSVFFVFASVFAGDMKESLTSINDRAYRPVFVNRLNRLAYDLWEHPAELADNKFIIDVPEIGVSLNNLSSVLTDDVCLKAISNDDYLSVLMRYFTMTGNGKGAVNELMKIDLGMGSQLGGFAFRIDGKVGLETYNERGYASLTTVKIVPDVDVAFSFGLGMKILDSDLLSLAVGASAHPSVRAFTDEISVQTVLENIDDTENLLKTDLFVGFALPFDLSVSVNLFEDQLKAYAQANNIMGSYKYIAGDYESLAEDVKDLMSSEDKFKAGHFELDLGCSYEPKNLKLIKPFAYAELSDIADFAKQAIQSKTFNIRQAFGYLSFGGYVEVMNMVQLGFDYKDGYRQLSAGLGFNDIKLQAFYGVNTYNNNVADTLSVVVKLGWDSN